ncbi:RNA polymerase II transcription factor SIII subunit A-domain-containing protein [Biscogniauxia marginata]|nr:RNA polymerase II transcription factor SIII subunit A-domain-containing protein [Biscogniauxia marginata]
MVKSLLQLCTAVCIKNIKEITDIGSTPYSVLRPILLKVDNATQLRQLEVASPHLEGDDAECWIRLIARDFPVLSERHKFEPRNPALWHRVYTKYQRLEAEQKREAEEKLKNAFAGIKKEKEGNVSQVITYDRRKLPRPPRDDKSAMGFRSGAGKRDSGTGGLRFTGGSRTKTNTAQSILKKAIREAKEIGARNRLNTPTGRLTAPTGQIARPPQAMVNEHIHKARPLMGIRPPAARPKSDARSRELEERETRLRKLKSTNMKTANFISDDELEEEDDLGDDNDVGRVGGGGLDANELEDLFDDDEPKTNPSPLKPGPSQAHFTSSSSTSTPRTGGILSRKPPGSLGSSSANKLAVYTKPGPAAQPMSPPPLSSSPPKTSAVGPSSTRAEAKPAMLRKRKAVDIFMKPKPKVARQ